MPDTLSRRPPRRFWGWGQVDAALDSREQSNLRFMLDQLGAVQCEAAPPRVEDSRCAPRIGPPAALAAMFSSQPLDRLNHSDGKSYADLARMWLRDVPEPPGSKGRPHGRAGHRRPAGLGGSPQRRGGALWRRQQRVRRRRARGGRQLRGHGVDGPRNGCTACWRWTAAAAPRASRPARWA